MRLSLLLWLLLAQPTQAGEVTVAVASNFIATAQAIATSFTTATDHRVILSGGSSGQLYAQISQHAPFEVFLSADQQRPRQAVAAGLAVQGSRFSYASGALVLWSAEPGLRLNADTLTQGNFSRLAIANPATAPYGAAALAVLVNLGVDEQLRPKLVQGNNINQTYQFVYTGNAELGLVAQAQLVAEAQGSRWHIPTVLYPPILQDAVLLTLGAQNPVAQAFLDYLRGPTARALILQHGYGLVD